MRNTAYNSSCTGPLRAPTIKSVPEMVLAKLVRASVRSRSTPTSRVTLNATEITVNRAVKRRLRRLFHARERIGIGYVPVAAAPSGSSVSRWQSVSFTVRSNMRSSDAS